MGKINPRFKALVERMKNNELPIEKVIPTAQEPLFDKSNFKFNFLEGALAEEVHNAIVNKYGTDNPFITSNINYSDEIIKGSKPGYVLAVNDVLKEKGMRVANSREIQRVIEEGILDLKGLYEDLGLVLFGVSGENEYLAKDLAKQIKKYQNLSFPILMPLNGLELKVDKNAPNDFRFNIKDKNSIIYAPQLERKNNGKNFSTVDNNELPVFDKNGTYTLYTSDSGLRVLCRDWYLDLGAGYWVLTNSVSVGRVVVCAEGTRARGGKK